MSTPKAVLYKCKTLKDGTHPVRISVYYGKQRYVSIGVSCKKDQWNSRTGRLNSKMPNRELLNDFIRQKEVLAETIMKQMIMENRPFSFDRFKQRFLRENSKMSYFEFLEFIKPKLSYSNAQKYDQLGRVVKAFMKYRKKTGTLMFEDIDKVFLKEFEYYLVHVRNCRGKKLKKNTIRFYFATLAACFNKAVEWEFIRNDIYPFKNVMNPKGFSYAKYKDKKPKPRLVSIPTLDNIKSFPVEEHPELADSLYYFIFSYYAHGMSFCDLATLKKNQIRNQRIYYSRMKTKGEVPSIKITAKMREIIEHYESDGEYVFPILDEKLKTEQEIYWGIVNARNRYSDGLEEIGKIVGAEIKLTSYVSRYTFANVLIKNGAGLRDVQAMMGHSSMETTLGYMEVLESKRRDELQSIL